MTSINSSKNFKPNVNRLTEYRIRLIMKYVCHCYLALLKEGTQYDFSNRGKVQKEDFLRNGLVNDYLSKKENKTFYKNYISDNPHVEIYFQKEENQPYQTDGVLADDFIDISIKETKLSEVLSGETGDEIRFAIECKRINAAKDCIEYIKDIQKFVDRSFTTYRLPFEGQIAFIENTNFNPTKMEKEINARLKNINSIHTIHYLKVLQFHKDIDSSYASSHKRNYKNNQEFSIFHLFFNYSLVIA